MSTSPSSDAAFPTLSSEHLSLLARFGSVERLDDRAFVFVEGQSSYDFIVILTGAIAVVRHTIDRTEVPIARHTPGRGVVPRLTKRMGHLSDHLPDRAAQQPRIGIQRDDIADILRNRTADHIKTGIQRAAK